MQFTFNFSKHCYCNIFLPSIFFTKYFHFVILCLHEEYSSFDQSMIRYSMWSKWTVCPPSFLLTLYIYCISLFPYYTSYISDKCCYYTIYVTHVQFHGLIGLNLKGVPTQNLLTNALWLHKLVSFQKNSILIRNILHKKMIFSPPQNAIIWCKNWLVLTKI